MSEALKKLDEEDVYLINRFGMTKEAIRNVLKGVRRVVEWQVTESIDHCDYYVDPTAYRDFTEEEWEKLQEEHDSDADAYSELYEFNDSPEMVFMDVISFHTRYGGHTSAIEACRMAGARWDE